MAQVIDSNELLRRTVHDSMAVGARLLESECLGQAADVARVMVECLRNDGTVFFFGNGGSATDAQHLAAELLGRFYLDRRPLPAVSLGDSSAAVTAIANDFGYTEVFSRQLRGLGRPGDVAVGLSTSGNSANVLAGLEAARSVGITTVALTGAAGGKLLDVADICIRVPAEATPRIQEASMLLGHTICEIVENQLQNLAD